MKMSRFIKHQIIAILKQSEPGLKVADICYELKWRGILANVKSLVGQCIMEGGSYMHAATQGAALAVHGAR